MRGGQAKVDFSMYVRAVPLLLAHPSVLALPLLAAVVSVLVYQITPFFTDAVGGLGAGIFGFLVQLVYLWAFGVAIIQASNIWRGRRGSFDEAWEEGRAKFGSIALAAIGFQFVTYAAVYIGSFINGWLGFVLQALAAFFLIYTIPAAAIGGMGQLAMSASVRTVRVSWIGSIVLALAFVALWYFVPWYALNFTGRLSPLLYSLCNALIEAIVLAYLAFPFAKQYDDVAFTRYW